MVNSFVLLKHLMFLALPLKYIACIELEGFNISPYLVRVPSMGRVDIRSRIPDKRIFHTDIRRDSYIETFKIIPLSRPHSIYEGDECIYGGNEVIDAVFYYKWPQKRLCRLRTSSATFLYFIKDDIWWKSVWKSVGKLEFREVDAVYAPSVVVDTGAPCFDTHGLQCTNYYERKIFRPMEHFNVSIVVTSGGIELFKLSESKNKRVVAVGVLDQLGVVSCSLEIIDELDVEETIYKVIKDGIICDMTETEITQWKRAIIIDGVINAVMTSANALGGEIGLFMKNSVYKIFKLRKFVFEPQIFDARPAFLVPYDIKTKNTKVAKIRTVSLNGTRTKHIVVPLLGYRFNPVMYGAHSLWSRQNEHAYRLEILESDSYRLIRMDLFISYHRTYSMFFQIDNNDALKFINPDIYFDEYVNSHLDCTIEADAPSRLWYKLSIFPQYDIYHSVVTFDHRVARIKGYGRILGFYQPDENQVVAVTLIEGSPSIFFTYLWVTIRESNGSLKYVNFAFNDEKHDFLPSETITEEVVKIREILAKTVATCSTEYYLLLKIEFCIPTPHRKRAIGFDRMPTPAEGEIFLVEEAPLKTVYTNEPVAFSNLTTDHWIVSAVYHNLLGPRHLLHYVNTRDSETNEEYFQCCLEKCSKIPLMEYIQAKKDFQINTIVDIRKNNKAITWSPTNDDYRLIGSATPGYFIKAVVNGNASVWYYDPDYLEVFHHIETVAYWTCTVFNVYVIHNSGRIYKAGIPSNAKVRMDYYVNKWMDAPEA